MKGPQGWEVRFGNYFLVERAILLSQQTILDEIDGSQKLSQKIDPTLLFGRLITCVRMSVANDKHEIYRYYTGGAEPDVKSQGFEGLYTEDSFDRSEFFLLINKERFGSIPPSKDVWKGYMKFGAHAIKVDAFVERILQLAGLNTVE